MIQISRQDAVGALCTFMESSGHVPTSREWAKRGFGPSVDTIRIRWGWKNVVSEAARATGTDDRRPHPGRPLAEREDAVRALGTFMRVHRRMPTEMEWDSAGLRPCAKTIRRRWGWVELVALVAEQTGIAPPPAPRVAVLEGIRAFHGRWGRWPKAKEWDRLRGRRTSARHVHRLFGSWDKALRAAGASPAAIRAQRQAGRGMWTKAQILADLRRWHRQHGAWPRASAWPVGERDHPRLGTVIRRFGTWMGALRAAGAGAASLRGRRGSASDEAIVAALRQWRRRTGRWPSYRQWRFMGVDHPLLRISPQPFRMLARGHRGRSGRGSPLCAPGSGFPVC